MVNRYSTYPQHWLHLLLWLLNHASKQNRAVGVGDIAGTSTRRVQLTYRSWTTPIFIVLLLQPWVLLFSSTGKAQQVKHGGKTFSGASDTEIPYPSPEGTSGQKDPGTLSEFKSYLAQSSPPEDKGVDAVGVLTSGPINNQEHFPVSFAIDSGNRFRLDITKADGLRSFRINGAGGHIQEPGQSLPELGDSEGLDPLAFPMALLELASRKDASLVDDGVVTVNEQTMRKLTITLFDTRLGNPTAVALYFNNSDHTLRKSAFIEHSHSNQSLEYLKVTTYGDYREEESVLLPHEYSETINGEPTMSLKVTSISIATSHDDSYFSF